MSHLDEGTLHALLDGELDLAEVSEIQGHLGSCVACGARLQEVKQFLAEADRLVGELNVPPVGVPGRDAGATPSPARQARKSPPLASPFHEPDPWEPPVILLPEATDPGARRRKWFRVFSWAAMIAVVIGGGRYLLTHLHSSSSLPAARDITMSTPAAPPAVASPQETSRPDSAPARVKAAAPAPRSSAPARAPLAKTKPEPKVPPEARSANIAADTSPELADSMAVASNDSAQPSDSDSTEVDQTLASAGSAESVATDSATPASEASEPNVDRRAAAEALARLDQERRRERAAAATAALPPARSSVQSASEAPAAPPVQRTPEQRAQIYLRIGLDEAGRQLGGPLHVIEGMSPQLIGLVQGRLVPGADPNRPVVRVVYLDTRGRMILLDQQRMRPGQAAPSGGSLRWAVGNVMLYLRGEPGPDVLRSLQRRVR